MKFQTIFFALLLLFAVGCTTPNQGGGEERKEWNSTGTLVGDWVLTGWADTASEDRIYLRLNEDSTFELYQRVYSVLWMRYTGTFTLNNAVLQGVYSDGQAWGSDYKIEYSDEPLRIRLTSTADDKDVSVYSSTTIPSNVVDDASDALNVRSVVIKRFL